jgi:DNA helicase-2/ATP-dependent DNA helicase PcrA
MPPPAAQEPIQIFTSLMAARGGVDFDDLVTGAIRALEEDGSVPAGSRASRTCVDEFQDVDAAQLRLIRLLAAPEDNLFVVGDDDQP